MSSGTRLDRSCGRCSKRIGTARNSKQKLAANSGCLPNAPHEPGGRFNERGHEMGEVDRTEDWCQEKTNGLSASQKAD